MPSEEKVIALNQTVALFQHRTDKKTVYNSDTQLILMQPADEGFAAQSLNVFGLDAVRKLRDFLNEQDLPEATES